MVLYRNGHFLPFPFPKGARRENRHVATLAEVDGVLHVGTMKGRFSWPFRGEAVGKGHPLDGAGGFDDLRALHAGPDGLLEGWRTHLVGGDGPGECIAFATAWERVHAGTLDGRLVEVNGRELRHFVRDGKGRPIRYMAFAHDALWLAVDGLHHRWDGSAWTSNEVEPYALHASAGRLWALARGSLWASDSGDWPRQLDVDLVRPWSLGSLDGELWVGLKGGLVRLVL